MDAANLALQASGLKELNPVQQVAVAKGFGASMVVAAPTASGKTLIAEIAFLETVAGGRKAVYIVPLKALAQEKYREFREKYPHLSVGLSIGDLDSSDSWLGKCDVIVTTAEKLDSLLRHGISWAADIGLVVADEIHLLNDPSRGPTLEMVLTRLMDYKPVILALSATIRNYQELASWLGAIAVKSDYRPVKLFTGVCYDNNVSFVPERQYVLSTRNVLKELTFIKKQSLVFVSTRRGTEATAEKLAAAVKPPPEKLAELQAIAAKVSGSLEHATSQCTRLAGCISRGTAFHHAGLTARQRFLVEEGFRTGAIMIICATPTLAAGVNVPAYRVIIRDLKRFSSFRGMDFLPVLEVQQMAGRAGRPAFDTEGEAILLPKNQTEAEYSWKHYIHGEPEKIYSKLGVEPVLRTHVLALIAGGVTPSRKALVSFFKKTFYAHQYRDMCQLTNHLDSILSMLERFGLIEPFGGGESESEFKPASFLETDDALLRPTRIGKRVSELYIDPITADYLMTRLGRFHELSLFTALHMISSCLEMRPAPGLRKRDIEAMPQLLACKEQELAERPPNEWDIGYEDFLRAFKLALVMGDWAGEHGEDHIMETYGVTPGELKARLDIADWLLYASQELGLLLGAKEFLRDIRKARLRLKYGVREELLPLIRLKGVGRVRARKLFDSGLGSLDRLRKASQKTIAMAVGVSAAAKIREQLGTC